MAPRRVGDRLGLVVQRRSRGQLASVQVHGDPRDEGHREHGQRAGIAGEPDVAGGEHVPRLVVPDIHGRAAREPEPPESVPRRHVLVAEGRQRSLYDRHASRVALRKQQRQAIQQEIGRARGLRRWRRPAGGSSHLAQTAAGREAAAKRRGRKRIQVGLAGQPDVERLEPLGGREQQRGSVAAAVQRERDLSLEQVNPDPLELVERSRLRRGDQCQRRVGRAGLVLGLRGGQRAL